MSAANGLEWLGAHAHLFDYHTSAAQRFRQDLMGWWTALERDEAEAAELWKRFLQLSKGGPVEAACGLYARTKGDRACYTDRMRRGEALENALSELPRAAITARCANALYLPDEQCFLGSVTGAQRHAALLAAALQKSAARAEALVARLNALTDREQEQDGKRQFTALRAAGGFRLWKAAVSLWFTATGFAAVPLWVRTVWTFFRSLLFEAPWQLAEALWQVEALHGWVPLPVIAVLLMAVPWAVFGWKQTLWEVWFAGYRRCALSALAAANRRRQRNTARLRQRIRQVQQQCSRSGKPWQAAKTTALAGFAAQLPGWVQVGRNPRLHPGRPHWLRDSFLIYPAKGPGDRKNASRHGCWVLVQGYLGAVLFVILYRGV